VAVTRHPCPFCGATVILDPAHLKSSHRAPVCKEFTDWIAANSREPPTAIVEEEDPATGELRPVAKA
jgi:hypothetical protein